MFRLDGETRIPDGRVRAAWISWEDGELDGDRALLDEARRRIALAEPVKATPSGPSAIAAAAPELVAAILAASLFQAFEVSGAFPAEVLDVDADAIA